MVRLGLMTSRFDYYNIKIFWWNEIKDLIATIKIPISNVKLPFYSPCEVKCRMQNGMSTVRFLNNIEIVREWELLIMGERKEEEEVVPMNI